VLSCQNQNDTALVLTTSVFLVCSLYGKMWDDGNSLGSKEVHNYLNRIMYNRHNKLNPLYNSLVLGGVKNDHKYLGTVNK
jgi:20S proteasome subunit beta 7